MAKGNTFSLPDDKGRYSQPNDGDSVGNIYMSYNLDFESNRGRVGVSEQVKKLITDVDDVDFDGYCGSIGAYSLNGTAGKIFAVSDKAFSASIADPLGTWTVETTGTEPDTGNSISDAAFFDGLYLVSESDTIKSWNGSTWSNWWTGTLGAAALTSGTRHLMEVGSDGNLYITDLGNKLYKVTPTGTVAVSGDGTLDFSATQFEFTCMVTNSNRLWIGTWDKTGKNAAILEWDMSATSSTVNRIHRVGAKKVNCIAIWNDRPVALLSDGKVKYFDNVSFTEFENPIQFPVSAGYELDEEFVHPNGWAIIDDLPHFLVSGKVVNTSILSTVAATKATPYQMPAGVWCLDPSIGLYHRFALGTGETTQEDYGKIGIPNVGALYSLQNTDSKFLASYEYYIDESELSFDKRSVLVYHDGSNSQASRGYLMTPFAYGLRDVWKTIETFHKELASGEKIKLFYRTSTTEALAQAGVWANTTTFNITDTDLGISVGDVALIKTGPGSGQLLRISEVNESSGTTSIVFEEANTFAAASDLGSADFLNFRLLGVIDDTTRDYHSFSIPELSKKRKTQFLIEYRQAASNKMEQDFVIINT